MSEFEIKILEQLRDIKDTINNRADEICSEIAALKDKEPNHSPFVNEERWD